MINGYNRTAYCGEFNESHIGKEVVVFGWAQKTRDLIAQLEQSEQAMRKL